MDTAFGNHAARLVQNEDRDIAIDHLCRRRHRFFQAVELLPPVISLFNEDEFLMSEVVMQLKTEFHRKKRGGITT